MSQQLAADWTAGTISEWQTPGDSADAKASESDLPAMEDAADLIAKPIDLPPDVIEGILHRGAKMVLGGATKSYKTWTLIDLAVSVATGAEWFSGYPTTRGRVLYINLELQKGWFTKRIRTVCDERQLTLESGYLKVWNLRGHAADLSDLRSLLLRGIGSNEFVLVIIDPIYKMLGRRDENKAGDIASLLNEIEQLAVKTGAAVAFGAHYSKGNQSAKESIDRIGGSGVFARDPDSILNFTKHEQDNCFVVEATLRNHPQMDPFVVRWEYPLMCVDPLLDPDKLKRPVSGAAVKKYHAADLLDVLTPPMSSSKWQATAFKQIEMSESTFYRLFRELKTSDAIKMDANREWVKS